MVSPHTSLQLTSLQSDMSRQVEECMLHVAKRNDTVRFVKMHNDDAEIEDTGVPAVLAYKGGEKFADIIPLIDALPDDSELSAVAFETLFRQ
jgi:hypothetical protein